MMILMLGMYLQTRSFKNILHIHAKGNVISVSYQQKNTNLDSISYKYLADQHVKKTITLK